MKNTIKIQARPTRDEEGIWDSSVGIFLDIEANESDYNIIDNLLAEMYKEIKRLYPPVQFDEFEMITEYREQGRAHFILGIDFVPIQNQYESSLFNIASLGCGVSAFLIAVEFEKLGYELRINHNKCSASDIMKDVINDLELSFFQEVVYNSCLYNERLNIYDDGELDIIIQKLKSDPELYRTVMEDFIEEKEGEFGIPKLEDNYIDLWDYSPLRISDLASDRIDSLCKNIKYKELRTILLNNI